MAHKTVDEWLLYYERGILAIARKVADGRSWLIPDLTQAGRLLLAKILSRRSPHTRHFWAYVSLNIERDMRRRDGGDVILIPDNRRRRKRLKCELPEDLPSNPEDKDRQAMAELIQTIEADIKGKKGATEVREWIEAITTGKKKVLRGEDAKALMASIVDRYQDMGQELLG